MDKKVKTKWVRALRSKKYKQGTRALYDNRTYCCLGVLARVQGATVVKGRIKIGDQDVRKGKDGDKAEYLAREFAAGLHTKTQERLGAMNDGSAAYHGQRKNFEQIADFIEKHL